MTVFDVMGIFNSSLNVQIRYYFGDLAFKGKFSDIPRQMFDFVIDRQSFIITADSVSFWLA